MWQKAASVMANGAFCTFSSTIISCGLACEVEKCGHRLVYWYSPQKYATVEQAYGLTEEQLLAVRNHRPSIMATSSSSNVDSGMLPMSVLFEA
ncbi:hypothetical protein FisN_18Hu245 [Fistulifera solaris]|uniref:Uncharacterized protein n=1 Tax=Fistulifera solaris TaxID=1519565 RepID=A0A1Z5KIN7_FISSO|nr:hypothetical protein FisN_18Hu245 [Fistulifera solaris]|eukprot:GAX26129.1 hypothetical protein FisN_18Hu245 [Fistulifera solaris]